MARGTCLVASCTQASAVIDLRLVGKGVAPLAGEREFGAISSRPLPNMAEAKPLHFLRCTLWLKLSAA